jgi:hypothetical protein
VLAVFALAAALCLSQSGAADVHLDSVTPSHGPAAATIHATLDGEGFEAGMRAALLGGGPFLEGTYAVPEGIRGLETADGHACVTFYSHTAKLGGIQILDLDDPAAPLRLGAFETGDSGLDVQRSGDLAYFTFMNPYTFLGGLHIVDVSDPAHPHRVGTFDILLDPQRIVVEGRYVYVAAGFEGLKIIDVLDPAAPLLAGERDTPGMAMDVKLAGPIAYVADGDALLVFDVGDPHQPVLIGSLYRERQSLAGLAIAGSRLLAADRLGALLVIDIGDPAHPALLAQVPLADAAGGVAVDGRFAYVASGYSGLQIVDLERRGGPAVVGSQGMFGNSAYFTGVALSGGRAYVADLINGIQVIDVANPAVPALLGSLDLAPLPSAVGNPGVVVAGRTAFVADAGNGLLAVDVGDPSSPWLRASLATTGPAAGLAAGSGPAEGFVFLAAGANGVRTIDARVPGSLTDVGGFDTAGEALGIAHAGGLVYVADGARGLAILDVAEPTAPRLLGSIDTPGKALGVAVLGALAFVADDSRGLRIFDVSHPEAPVLAGAVDTPGRAVGVAVGDGRAYVADLNRGIQIIDVTRPEAPVIVANLGTPGAAGAVWIEGDRLLVADGFSGVLEFDVRDPAQALLTGLYDTPGIASGIALSGGLAYVADRTGLRILRPNPPLPAPSLLSSSTAVLEVPAGFAPGPYDLVLAGAAGAAPVLPNAFTVQGIAGPGRRRP